MNQVVIDLDPENTNLDEYNFMYKNYFKKKISDFNEDQKSNYKIRFEKYFCIKSEEHKNYLKSGFLILEIKSKEIEKIKRLPPDDIFIYFLRNIIRKNHINSNKIDRETRLFLCFLSSNLVHTLNPDYYPVWGRTTLKYLLQADDLDQIRECLNKNKMNFKIYNNIYLQLTNKSHKAIKEKDGWFKNWNIVFDKYFKEKYPDFQNFTDIKKIDLFFWKYPPINDKFYASELNKDIVKSAAAGKVLLILRHALLLYVKSKYNSMKFNQWERIIYICVRLFKESDIPRHIFITNNFDNLGSDLRKDIGEKNLLKDWDVIPLFELFELINIIETEKINILDDTYENIEKIFLNNKFKKYPMNYLVSYRNHWAHQQPYFNIRIKDISNLVEKLLIQISNSGISRVEIKKIQQLQRMLEEYTNYNMTSE